MVFDKELDENLKVCTHCGYHFRDIVLGNEFIRWSKPVRSRSGLELLSVDILELLASPPTRKSSKRIKGLQDSRRSYHRHRADWRISCSARRDGFFIPGGSMGSVVGEKLTRLIEAATEKALPLIIISTSGGARNVRRDVQLDADGKTCAAWRIMPGAAALYQRVNRPTTAGVMASYASVGDLIIAEPGAMIGFAGRGH